MGQTLAHRGPDAQNEYIEDRIGLGYRRLAIIDTKGSFQPLFNEDKTIVLFYNGEIYNYKDLRSKLTKHLFKTDGDGETIIHWYEDHGPEGFKNLNGIFAFALLDKKKQQLLLVRDHLGIKPLYYFSNGNILAYASEIKAILPVLRSLKVKISSNNQTIQKYLLTRRHDDGENTFFQGIKRLPQGSFLELNLKSMEIEIEPYWALKPDHSLIAKTDEENIAKFRRLFVSIIRHQLMSEVPLGTALSGGLDSSAVVMAVNRAIEGNIGSIKDEDRQTVIGERQKTFSARFPNAANDETKYIDIVTRASSVDSHLVRPQRQEMWPDLQTVIYHQDEPMISSGPYAQWKVMELAHKNGIRVMLDGQGADEMLAGYDAYFFVYFRELLAKRDYGTLFQEVVNSLDILWKYLREKIAFLIGIKKSFAIKKLFNFETKESNKSNSTNNNLNKRLQEDLFETSLPSLLRYEDHNSMAHSIEARVPFLDHRLVEFVASLPSHYKIRNGWNKWIMRQALKDLLPEKILKRRWKVGFTTPEIAWLRDSATEVRKIFNSESFNSRPYFNTSVIKAKFEEFVAGKNDESMVFWRIINLELWLRIFIDK
ncbi:MAG: Asparagine synthetase (Glutamine-hydrolyzing) [Microgenomates group bacterium GW2011_GWA1_48_10]|nr:MAG: Asparagine synthetase (Glutamine-hydrolyzing) [Microgenomates group bacterium GW2011_GWA1_48_10]